MTVTTTPASLAEQYLAMWNEADAGRRAEIIAASWATDCSYVDPSFEVTGHDGLVAMVDTAQQMFPGLAFRLAGDIDAHHDRLRWSWELAPEGQQAVAGGTDIVTLDADGKIRDVIGFLNFAPAH